jgi:transcriptional/translational regulatory protein YebC/TACO1
MELVLDAGAEDIQDGDDVWEILTDVDKYNDVLEALEKKGIETVESKIARIPKTVNVLNKSQAEKVMNLLEALEDLDDVQNVWSNFDYEE